jgi:hypothetical protein
MQDPAEFGDHVSDSQTSYVPGLMDQFDTQLFGRFLPPFMMSNHAGVGVGLGGGDGANFDEAIGEVPGSQAAAAVPLAAVSPGSQIGPSQVELGLSQPADFDPNSQDHDGLSSWDDFVSQQMELSGITGI